MSFPSCDTLSKLFNFYEPKGFMKIKWEMYVEHRHVPHIQLINPYLVGIAVVSINIIMTCLVVY